MAFDTSEFRIEPGQAPNLAKRDTRATTGWDSNDKAGGIERHLELNKRFEELQERLWAEGKNRLLVVLQAMDAGGKDGTVRHVFERVNPTGVKVISFKKPTHRELAHDYLWRIHKQVPGDGEIVVFNRSHYEDVLVVRVLDMATKSLWSKRYEHIVNFEQMLADEGTTIIKIFLHISRKEQQERLQSRLDEPNKNWKFDPGDLIMRERWDEFQEAFEDAIEKTSTSDAPWYVIPADRKWFRNIAISEIMVQTLEGLNMEYPDPAPGLADITIPD